MSQPHHPNPYRRDIDGLRAVAVLSVVVFHLDASWLPGGFTGVDIFFVISGFLITSIIAREMSGRRFSFAAFYRRRILRIAPVYTVVTLCALIAGVVLMLPEDLVDLARSAAWSAVALPNVFFWWHHDSGYFADATDQLPLLHLWSLGVEEQFYLCWPLLLVGLTRLGRRVLVPLVVVTLAVASFWFAQRMAVVDHSFAYYMLPTRAGELLAGALLALLLARRGDAVAQTEKRPGWLDEIAGMLGVALMAAGLFLLDRQSHFPGWNALYPGIGAALVIFAGRHGGCRSLAFLSWRPMVAIGLISYSLYLWHWPILAFIRYFTATIDPWLAALAVAVMLLASWASYRLVEQPFRRLGHSSRAGRRAGQMIAGGYLLSAAGLAGLALALTQWAAAGGSSTFDARTQAIVERTRTPNAYGYNCQSWQFDPKVLAREACVWRPAGTGPSDPVSAIVLGDSNAAHYIGVLGVIAESAGVAVRNATVSACPPVMGSQGVFGMRGWQADCQAYRDALDQAVAPYRTVFLGAAWAHYVQTAGFWEDLEQTVTQWSGQGRQVVLLGQVPRFPAYDRKCELRRVRMRLLDCEARAVGDWHDFESVNARLRELAGRIGNVRYLNAASVLCADGRCSPYLDGLPAYFDTSHMSMDGSWAVGARWLDLGLRPGDAGLGEVAGPASRFTVDLKPLTQALPHDLFFGFRYNRVSDQTTWRDGRRHRTVKAEYFGQDAEAIAASLRAGLAKVGYRQQPGENRPGEMVLNWRREQEAARAVIRDRDLSAGSDSRVRGDLTFELSE